MTIKCFRCGDCCKAPYYGMTLTQEELDLLPVKLDTAQLGKNRFRPKGNICPFLILSSNDNTNSGSYDINSVNYQCSIYDIRPCQCRLFHCGRLHSVDKNLNTIQDIRNLMDQNTEYREFKKQTDLDAIMWGNSHGWNWKKMHKRESNKGDQ